MLQFHPYSISLLSASLLSLLMLYFAVKEISSRGSQGLILLNLGAFIWTSMYAMYWVAIDIELKILFFNLMHIGIFLTAIGLYGFAYSIEKSRDFFTSIHFLYVSLFPLAAIFVLFIEPNIFFIKNSISLDYHLGLAELKYRTGWFYLIMSSIYPLLISIIALLKLLKDYLHSFEPYKSQTRLFIIGVALVISVSIFSEFYFFINKTYMFRNIDLTATALVFAMMLYTFGAFKYGFNRVLPIARELVFDSIEEAIIVIDQMNNIIDFNNYAERIFYSTKKEIIGTSLREFFIQDKEFYNKYGFLKQVHCEDTIFISNKESFFEIKIDPICTDTEKCIGKVMLLRDISFRKAYEREIVSLNEKLTELNKSKDMFFSIISHDLRSPFGGIMELSKELANNLDSINKDELKEIAYSLAASSASTYRLLENLLEWSRMQTNTIQLLILKINIEGLVNNVITTLNQKAIAKNITLINKIESKTFVLADINMLESIFRNLISNAIKFSPKGNEISISAIKLHDMVEITVSDNGIGIDKDNISRLFDIKNKYTSPGTEGEASSGLGLILVKEYIEKHKGSIRVESTIGKGTNFIFTLSSASQDQL